MKYVHKATGLEVESIHGTFYFLASEEQVLKLGFESKYTAPPNIVEVKTCSGGIYTISADRSALSYDDFICHHLSETPKSTIHAIQQGYRVLRIGETVKESASRDAPFVITEFKYDTYYKKWYVGGKQASTLVAADDLVHFVKQKPKYLMNVETGIVYKEGEPKPIGNFVEVTVQEIKPTSVYDYFQTLGRYRRPK